jgi:predicted  nucleic acid-binding Zn-ribbon protein
MSVVSKLYQLQLVDSEGEEKAQRLAAINAQLGESDEVRLAREGVADTEQGLGELRSQMRDLELEIAGLNAKLKKNQDRLYSGRVRNPKELSNLQEEAASFRRRRSELEDGQLELMIAIEEEEAELAERQARLRQIQSTWDEEQASLSAERDKLELRLVDLEEERSRKRAGISAADLALYDDLRQGLGGTGVAQLRRGICQVCGVDVPTGLRRSVERDEGLSYCPTCGRLLFGG